MSLNAKDGGVGRAAYLVPVAALLYALAQAIRFDVFNRAMSLLASAVWGS